RSDCDPQQHHAADDDRHPAFPVRPLRKAGHSPAARTARSARAAILAAKDVLDRRGTARRRVAGRQPGIARSTRRRRRRSWGTAVAAVVRDIGFAAVIAGLPFATPAPAAPWT